MTSEWLLQNKHGLTCRIICGDSREVLKEFQNTADLLMTSPPYADARKGLYDSVVLEDYAEWFGSFHSVFSETLKHSGSLVMNIKDKVVDGVRRHYVWQTIQQLESFGWHCIEDYLWHKKTSMPGYWPTRLRDAWEYVFHLSKVKKPYLDQEAVKIPISKAMQIKAENIEDNGSHFSISTTGSGFSKDNAFWKNKMTVLPTNVLHISPENHNRRHPAVYPVALPLFFIKLLSKPNAVIIDPFSGSGSTGVAAIRAGRHCILIDNKLDYCLVAKERLEKECRMSLARKNKDFCDKNLFARSIAEPCLSPLD